MKKEKFQKIINNIDIEGFENFGYLEDNNACLLMNRKNQKKWLKISLTFGREKTYTYLEIRFKINFLPVTQTLNKVMKIEYRSEYPYLWENADTLTIGDELFFEMNDEKVRPTLKHTMTEQDIADFYNQIQLVYDKYLQPFIDMYPDLQTVNDEIINKIPQMEVGSIIPGAMPFKKQIIMKICNNENYIEYVNWLNDIYQIDLKNPNDRFYKQNVKEYEIFKKLTDYLESDKYKEFM
jgi:hypothetical protein